MIDATATSSVIAGVIAAVTTTSIGGMLFRGDRVVLRRELDTEKERTAEAKADAAKLLSQNEKLQAELKEQYHANAALVREVLDKVDYLQSIAGLAVRDRRAHDR